MPPNDSTSHASAAPSAWRDLRWMASFLRPVKRLVALACLYLSLWIGAEILAVRWTAQAVNEVQRVLRQGSSSEAPGFWGWLRGGDAGAAGVRGAILLLGACSLAMAVFTYLREVAVMKMSMHKVFFIREAVYDRLQRVGMRFHDRVSTGELINRALSDLQNVRSFVNSAVLVTLEILLLVGGYIAVLALRSPLAALFAVAPIPLWVWYTVRFSRRVRPAQVAVMEAADRNVSLIAENVAGVHVVKAFGAESHEIARYGRNCDEFMARTLERIRLYAGYAPTIRAISMGSHLALFLLAGILILRGVLEPGDVLLLGSAMAAILGRLQQVATVNEQYQNALVSSQRLREVIHAEATVPERREAPPLPPGGGAVEFEDVVFGYDPAQPILRGIRFSVAAGQVVALVGPTGSGKTSLTQLIARFYDPQAGRVLIDGADVREVSLESLRREVAVVFQESYLFSDTIAANIAYGRPAEADAVEEVSQLAQAHEFVEALPARYQTLVGERGANLSGGQRQRLAIARALFTRPRILILDDATAAVDPETEELIHGGLRGALRGRTVFIIAHRLRSVRDADLVLVLEKGRIVQSGRHQDLLAVPGHYRDVAAAQLLGDEHFGADGQLRSHLRRSQDERLVDAERSRAALSGVDETRREEEL